MKGGGCRACSIDWRELRRLNDPQGIAVMDTWASDDGVNVTRLSKMPCFALSPTARTEQPVEKKRPAPETLQRLSCALLSMRIKMMGANITRANNSLLRLV